MVASVMCEPHPGSWFIEWPQEWHPKSESKLKFSPAVVFLSSPTKESEGVCRARKGGLDASGLVLLAAASKVLSPPVVVEE